MFVKPLLAVKSANLLIFKQGFANKPPISHARAAATLWGRASHAPTIRRRIYAPPAVAAPVTVQATPAALSSATHDRARHPGRCQTSRQEHRARLAAATMDGVMCKFFFCCLKILTVK